MAAWVIESDGDRIQLSHTNLETGRTTDLGSVPEYHGDVGMVGWIFAHSFENVRRGDLIRTSDGRWMAVTTCPTAARA